MDCTNFWKAKNNVRINSYGSLRGYRDINRILKSMVIYNILAALTTIWMFWYVCSCYSAMLDTTTILLKQYNNAFWVSAAPAAFLIFAIVIVISNWIRYWRRIYHILREVRK